MVPGAGVTCCRTACNEITAGMLYCMCGVVLDVPNKFSDFMSGQKRFALSIKGCNSNMSAGIMHCDAARNAAERTSG